MLCWLLENVVDLIVVVFNVGIFVVDLIEVVDVVGVVTMLLTICIVVRLLTFVVVLLVVVRRGDVGVFVGMVILEKRVVFSRIALVLAVDVLVLTSVVDDVYVMFLLLSLQLKVLFWF